MCYPDKLPPGDAPLLVQPRLAQMLGLNEAMLLQQCHYWLCRTRHVGSDGCHWFYCSVTQWREQFPFWSVNTIRRAITSLERAGLLLSRQEDSPLRAKWYRIDMERLERMLCSYAQNDAIPSQYGHAPTQNGYEQPPILGECITDTSPHRLQQIFSGGLQLQEEGVRTPADREFTYANAKSLIIKRFPRIDGVEAEKAVNDARVAGFAPLDLLLAISRATPYAAQVKRAAAYLMRLLIDSREEEPTVNECIVYDVEEQL